MLLCELDPFILLRLDGDSVGDGVPVTVHDLDDDGRRFFLTECRDADDRSADTRTDL